VRYLRRVFERLRVVVFGRPTVWLAQWKWYAGKATGYCCFSSRDEAIKYAIFQSQGFVDWSTFPDPKKRYPYDDRDGSHIPELSPVFRASWPGGCSEVSEVRVSDRFDFAADYAQEIVARVFSDLRSRGAA
jgi:hypothetical protein